MKTVLFGLMMLSLCSLARAEDQASLESRLQSRFQWKQAGEEQSETITLAELFARIHQEHGIRIRLDRVVSSLMVESLAKEGESVVWPSGQTAGTRPLAGLQMPGISITTGGTYAYPNYPPNSISSPTPSGGGNYGFSVTSPSPSYGNPLAVSDPAVIVAPTPVQTEIPYPIEPITREVESVPATPVKSSAPEISPAPVSQPPVSPEAEPGKEEQATSIQNVPEILEEKKIQIGLHEKVFEQCSIPTSYLDDSMTVEQVIRAAISQIGTMLDVSGELHGIPSSYTHAWDWDLMVRDETVFITTKLQSNLHKVVRVYKLPKSSGLTTEALAACVKKTIRPWSWRDQIDKVIDIVEFDLPPGFKLPDLSNSNLQVDLSGQGELISVNKEKERENASSESNSSGLDPSASWAAMKAMGALFSSGAKAFAHGMLYTTEMLHYADPPTSTIEILPNMLIITQSRGAHREIADLLEQISATSAE